MAAPAVSSSRTHVREVRMLVHHEWPHNSWHDVPSSPAASVMVAGTEFTVLNRESLERLVWLELVQRGRELSPLKDDSTVPGRSCSWVPDFQAAL